MDVYIHLIFLKNKILLVEFLIKKLLLLIFIVIISLITLIYIIIIILILYIITKKLELTDFNLNITPETFIYGNSYFLYNITVTNNLTLIIN